MPLKKFSWRFALKIFSWWFALENNMSKNSRRLCLRANRLGTKIVKKTHLDIFSKRLTWKLSQKELPGIFVKKTHLEIKSKRINWKICQKDSAGNFVKKTYLEIKYIKYWLTTDLKGALKLFFDRLSIPFDRLSKWQNNI